MGKLSVRLLRGFVLLLSFSTGFVLFQNCAPTTVPSTATQSSQGGRATPTPTPPIDPNVAKPYAPSQLMSTTVSSTQINLTWTDNSLNESNFYIERAPDLSGSAFPGSPTIGTYVGIGTTNPNVTTYADTTVQPSTTYHYRVSARNAGGSSAPTAAITAATGSAPSTAPAAPANLTAAAAAATIVNLSWSDSSNESYYILERSSGGGAYTQVAAPGAGITTYQDINLLAATSYTYRIRAVNGAGQSANSTTATAATLAAGATNTFTYINTNIIGPNCASCHSATLAAGGVNLSNYNAISSRLSQVTSAISGGRMPPGAPISALMQNQLSSWINAGAPNN